MMNGWYAVIGITETVASLDGGWPMPGTLSPQTALVCNRARQVDAVSLAQGDNFRSAYESAGRLGVGATVYASLASNGFTRVLCYHAGGALYAAYQRGGELR